MTKLWITILLCLIAGMAWGDWSQDIILWEPGPDPDPGGFLSDMEVDSSENVHIVHQFRFWHPERPMGPPFTGLRYVKLDDWGHVLTSTIVSDSSFNANSYAHIVFFAQDSLWVVWRAGRSYFDPEEHYYAVRALDLDGNLLGPQRAFQEADSIGIGLAVDVRHDQTVAFVYPEHTRPDHLRAIVQQPDGGRILDTAIVWSAPEGTICDRPDAFIDHTDSLQIVWREAYYSFWQSVFAKRVNTIAPFDPGNLSDHAELTPAQGGFFHFEPNVQPIDTSCLVLVEQGGVNDQYIHILARADYDSVAETIAGESGGASNAFAVEGDSVIGIVAGFWMNDYEVHLQRYRIPDLFLLSDEFIGSRPTPGGGFGRRAYTVSPAGERHILLWSSNGGGDSRLIYRFWRSDLAVRDEPPRAVGSTFTVTPNPAVDRITINGPLHEVKEVKIYDIMGRLVGRQWNEAAQGQRNTLSLSLEGLPGGVYFVRIATVRQMQIQKVILLR